MSAAELTETRPAPRARSQLGRAWSRFRANRFAFGSTVFLGVLIVAAVSAPLIAPYGYSQTDYDAILQPTGAAGHLLGTDELGRDILSRLMFSLRTAFVIAFGAELTALFIALVIGLLAGYAGGRADQLLMGFVDIMYAYPTYLLSILIVTVFGRGVLSLAVAIGIASFVTQSRLVRAQTLSLKAREFVEAAHAMGAGGPTIALRYILPNAVGPIVVTSSFGLPGAIITAAGLSLLGLGVQPPTPDLGQMLNAGTQYVIDSPHMLAWPALLFALLLLAFTWLGDGLRDAFDVND